MPNTGMKIISFLFLFMISVLLYLISELRMEFKTKLTKETKCELDWLIWLCCESKIWNLLGAIVNLGLNEVVLYIHFYTVFEFIFTVQITFIQNSTNCISMSLLKCDFSRPFNFTLYACIPYFYCMWFSFLFIFAKAYVVFNY